MSDVEGGLRAWLRGQLGHQRVFVDTPPGAQRPYVVVGLVDASDDRTCDAPLDVTLVQIDCWGRTKTEAHDTYTAVRESLRSARGGLTLTAGTTLRGAQVVGSAYLPDAEDKSPRYVITAQVIVN